MPDLQFQATINGRKISRSAKPHQRLLDFIRDDLNLTGNKEGCGAGECGTCSVFVDGTLMKSCLLPVAKAQDRRAQRLAKSLSQDGRQPMRLLHPRHGDGGNRRASNKPLRRP
jgi:aerobic-type carbon monoxide dehydrogenase small subunit (CoxS/CutS family)